jgi:hypothetical protein
MPATPAAHRIAVFHSTCCGRGGGIRPVLGVPSTLTAGSPPVSTDWFSIARKSCGVPQCGQNGDSPLP